MKVCSKDFSTPGGQAGTANERDKGTWQYVKALKESVDMAMWPWKKPTTKKKVGGRRYNPWCRPNGGKDHEGNCVPGHDKKYTLITGEPSGGIKGVVG